MCTIWSIFGSPLLGNIHTYMLSIKSKLKAYNCWEHGTKFAWNIFFWVRKKTTTYMAKAIKTNMSCDFGVRIDFIVGVGFVFFSDFIFKVNEIYTRTYIVKIVFIARTWQTEVAWLFIYAFTILHSTMRWYIFSDLGLCAIK